MDDKVERDLLIQEIMVLEQAIVDSGRTNITFPSDPSFFESFSTPELRLMRTRFERLARSIGGLRSQ